MQCNCFIWRCAFLSLLFIASRGSGFILPIQPSSRHGVQSQQFGPRSRSDVLRTKAHLPEILISASRYLKDVPSTLSDMSDAAGKTVAPYTLPDGSYTNAKDVAEDVVGKADPGLPPPYYAVIFAFVIFGLAAVQQLSLGNVFDDEAESAKASGAVARRQNMRNRSFFKKK